MYPGFPDGYNQVLVNRSAIKAESQTPLVYSRFGGIWHYTHTFPVDKAALEGKDIGLLQYANVVSVTIGSKVWVTYLLFH